MLFEKTLPHQFQVVNKQVGAGLHGVKSIAAVLNSMCVPDPKVISGAENIIKDRAAKTNLYNKKNGTSDEQMMYMMASSAVVDATKRILTEAHPNFLKNTQTDIGNALYAFHKNTETIRAGLEADVKRLETNLESSKSKTAKLKTQCTKIHAQLLAKKMSVDKLSSGDTTKKAVNEREKFAALTKKAADMFAQYNTEVKTTDQMQTDLYEKKMPHIMKSLEAIERTRLQMVEDKFIAYQRHLQDYIDELTAIQSQIALIPPTLHQDDAINTFGASVLSRYGKVGPPPPPITYDLPVTAQDLTNSVFTSKNNVGRGRRSIIPSNPSNVDVPSVLNRIGSKYKELTGQSPSGRQQRGQLTVDPPASVPAPPPSTPRTVKGDVVVATYDFDGTDPGDISFMAGEEIRVETSDGAWWTGVNDAGKTGNFPSNYVVPKDKSTSQMAANCVKCIALYDFVPEPGPDAEDCLTFKEGDVILATPQSEEWWKGTLNGVTGIFPLPYVQLVEDDGSGVLGWTKSP